MRGLNAGVDLVGLGLAIAGAGCQFSEGRGIGRAVTADEVIGSWVLTPGSRLHLESVDVLLAAPTEAYHFVLDSDGTCAFHTFVVVPLYGGAIAPLRTTLCRWELFDEGSLRQKVIVDLRPTVRGRASFWLAEEGGELVLWQFAGDPDAWKYVDYIRHRKDASC